jgi:hypothetical protein
MNSTLYDTINDPEKWTPRMAEPCSASDLAWFQAGLDRIFGDGMARIAWGQDWERTKQYNRYGDFWYPAYLSHTNEDNEYVMAPRYIVEGKITVEVFKAMGGLEAGREATKIIDPNDPLQREQELESSTWKAAPLVDQWEELIRIDWHDPVEGCCNWNKVRGFECWGYFRKPDQADLDYLAARVQAMQRELQGDPRVVRTPEEKARLLRRRMEQMTERNRQRKEIIAAELQEFFSSKFARLDQSVTEQAHGPYLFLNQPKQGAKSA